MAGSVTQGYILNGWSVGWGGGLWCTIGGVHMSRGFGVVGWDRKKKTFYVRRRFFLSLWLRCASKRARVGVELSSKGAKVCVEVSRYPDTQKHFFKKELLTLHPRDRFKHLRSWSTRNLAQTPLKTEGSRGRPISVALPNSLPVTRYDRNIIKYVNGSGSNENTWRNRDARLNFASFDPRL